MTLRRYLLLVLCAIAGAGVNVYRGAHWLMHDEVRYAGFDEERDRSTGAVVRWAHPYATVRVSGTVWRPLAVALRLCGPPERVQDALRVTIEANYRPVTTLAVPVGCTSYALPTHEFANGDILLGLSSLTDRQSRGVGVADVDVSPIYTARAVAWHLFSGGLVGAAVWALLLVPARTLSRRAVREDVPANAAAPAGLRSMHAALAFAIIAAYLSIWAMLKPPLQSPDEVQHLLRAQSVPAQPWATGVSQIRPSPRFANPLALVPPGALGKLFFHNDQYLSPNEIVQIKVIPWERPPGAPDSFDTALATYPNGYYAPLLALAESTTWLLRLTPYQATYAYRGWSLLLASLLWTLVYCALVRLPEVAGQAAGQAAWIVTFLLLNPMLAFVSSSASPDSVNVPLGALSIVLMYRTVTTGRDGWLACLALVACGLTKPSAPLLGAGLMLAMLALSPHAASVVGRVSMPPLPDITRGVLMVIRALLILFVVYYAWSPLRFQASAPLSLDAWHYLHSLSQRKVFLWVTYWGRLGWLDYQLPSIWYVVLAPLVLINLACAWFTLEHGRRFAAFAALAFFGYFIATSMGEFFYLPMAGFNLHGRHLLPACIGLAGLVLHRVRLARWGLVGYLALMNVAFMQMSVVRYFGGDWSVMWFSRP